MRLSDANPERVSQQIRVGPFQGPGIVNDVVQPRVRCAPWVVLAWPSDGLVIPKVAISLRRDVGRLLLPRPQDCCRSAMVATGASGGSR